MVCDQVMSTELQIKSDESPKSPEMTEILMLLRAIAVALGVDITKI